MCQAFEGESNYIHTVDKHIRSCGYDAQKAGVLREDCPEREHELPHYSDANQWRMGWDTAKAGREKW